MLIPSKSRKFLGFIFNSENMTIRLPEPKIEKIGKGSIFFSSQESCKIRTFAQFLGLIVSACPAVKYGWLYTKSLEREKYLALLQNNLNYNGRMRLSPRISSDLHWWASNIKISYNVLKKNCFDLIIFTDASLSGWGAVCKSESTHGWWTLAEKGNHINFLELQAIFYGLKCFARSHNNINILIRTDNTTALSYINRMGSVRYPKLNSLSRQIWQWCESRNIWLLATYINSKDNWQADQESRKLSPETEWSLAPYAFEKIVKAFGSPKFDLFASKDNFKCPNYVSWHRDPGSLAVDAFTISWSNLFFYAFPSFSLILQSIQKIFEDKADGILVVPFWPSQPWFPLLLKLQICHPVIFEPSHNLLSSVFSTPHPLATELTLAAYRVSGKPFY